MKRYRVEAQEFEAELGPDGWLSHVGTGGSISPAAVKALGIVEVAPEPDAIVYRDQGYSTPWGVAANNDRLAARFFDREDAIAWAREKFGPNVKVEE